MPEEYARPIHRSNQVCHILEYVIVGASSYVAEASCLKMSGSAYLGPGVLIVNKKKNSKTETIYGPRPFMVCENDSIKKAKKKFSIKIMSNRPILYHVYFCIVAFWIYQPRNGAI